MVWVGKSVAGAIECNHFIIIFLNKFSSHRLIVKILSLNRLKPSINFLYFTFQSFCVSVSRRGMYFIRYVGVTAITFRSLYLNKEFRQCFSAEFYVSELCTPAGACCVLHVLYIFYLCCGKIQTTRR